VIERLQLTLDHSASKYHLQATREPLSQVRAQHSFEHHQPDLQVLWAMTTREREEHLIPLRIPIYKGLIGWRVNLLEKSQQHLLSNVRTLDDLKALRFGQRQPCRIIQHARRRTLRGLPARSGSRLATTSPRRTSGLGLGGRRTCTAALPQRLLLFPLQTTA
jgi:hypothetical protein